MSPKQLSTLGPELLPWASEYTNDLNEARTSLFIKSFHSLLCEAMVCASMMPAR